MTRDALIHECKYKTDYLLKREFMLTRANLSA